MITFRYVKVYCENDFPYICGYQRIFSLCTVTCIMFQLDSADLNAVAAA